MKDKILGAFNKTKDLKEQLQELEESIAVEDIVNEYNYLEDKEMLEDLAKDVSGEGIYWLSNKIHKALKELKTIAYPEVLGVKYYKKYLDKLETNLSEDTLIYLDNELRRVAKQGYVYATISLHVLYDTEQKVFQELYKMGVIAPAVEVALCDCMGNTGKLLGNKKYGEKLHEFLGVESEDEDEIVMALEQMDLQCNSCWEDTEYSGTELLEIIKYAYDSENIIRFKVLVEPDLTLENL